MRLQARQAKDWAKPDQIRAQLEAKSILVMDTQEGVSWRIKLG